MLGVADFRIVLRIRFVMANPAEVAEQLARSDGPFLCWERRAIFLYRRIEINFAALPKLHRRGRGQRFRDGTESIERARSRGHGIFEIGKPESLGPNQLAILDNGR